MDAVARDVEYVTEEVAGANGLLGVVFDVVVVDACVGGGEGKGANGLLGAAELVVGAKGFIVILYWDVFTSC